MTSLKSLNVTPKLTRKAIDEHLDSIKAQRPDASDQFLVTFLNATYYPHHIADDIMPFIKSWRNRRQRAVRHAQRMNKTA